ncbi:FAD-binding-3 domain-containing protein [Mycena indigotica]|uniref:FAD-binding-3 domain-containing protein n=1 Tax=Mycena indigotica TaxID=2126181 RepID=A0A8H6T2R1_9AGAR|nr:FAD-binding-3 domain-containing protein [Mycena indigotica]KAF7309292.1 FAD-binding-3 domain-containing protein [Mycena indigotica]
METEPQVLIAGAGPSGLVLALILRRSGVRVRIIDKEPAYRPGSRGSGVQARTLELYAQLGLYQEIAACGAEIPNIALYKPGKENLTPQKEFRLTERAEATPGMPYPNALNIPQDAHEAVLRGALVGLGCTVELGVELTKFSQHSDGVRTTLKHADGTEEVAEAAWLVGADGAHSVVRKGLGLNFLGETHEEQEMLIGDIEVDGVSPGLWHMWADPPRTMVLRSATPDSNLFMFAYVPGTPGAVQHAGPFTRDEFVETFYEVTQRTDITFGRATWLSRYRPNMRMVDQMRAGRVFVAGDAAHCHSPAGGQGLNSSVQDAANLAWKLALVINHHAPEALLDTYAEERLRVIAQMLQLTTALYNSTFDALRLKQQLDADGTEDAPMGTDRNGAGLSMLGVNYSGSSIIAEDNDAGPAPAYAPGFAETGVRAAYRAPDAPGLVAVYPMKKETSLFEVFDVALHTVLLFGASSAAISGLRRPAGATQMVQILPASVDTAPLKADGVDIVLHDARGHAYAGYGVEAGETVVVVVRPDGVVGMVQRGSAEEAVKGLAQYFAKIFG